MPILPFTRMQILLTFLLRLVFVAAGLAFAASLAVAFALTLAVWGLRAAWAKLTGRPVAPFIIRINPRAGFDRMYKRSAPQSRTPRADATRAARGNRQVTDVVPREPRA